MWMKFFATALALALGCPAVAMELVWTRGTGQFRYEATPMLVDADGDGDQEILGVNLGGQVLLWNQDGTDAGPGQDGTVTTLPQGTWCSTPAIVGTGAKALYVFVSVEGLVAALNAQWQPAWQLQLPGKTQWGKATPAVDEEGQRLFVGDLSGAFSCIAPKGEVIWQQKLETGGCTTPPTLLKDSAEIKLLMPAGNVLHALTVEGKPAWESDLGGQDSVAAAGA